MNPTVRRLAATLAIVALGTFSFALAGCGEATEKDPTPVKTWKITPAEGGQKTPTPAAATATKAPSGTAPAGGTVLEIVGQSSLFDKTELEAPAGTVTVKFDNQEAGVVHNIHFFKGDDAKADDLAETDLETGPILQEVIFTVEPGEYFYQCDAHPTTMKGVLTVN